MRNRSYIIIVVLYLIFGQISFGQLNADSLFKVASQLAVDEKYDDALYNVDMILESNPAYFDANVLAANLHAWSGDYMTAKYYIRAAEKAAPTSEVLYDSWMNILLWNQEYESLLEITDIAKENGYKNDVNLNMKKLQAYQGLEQYDKAIELFEKDEVNTLLDSANMQQVYDGMLLSREEHVLSFLDKAQAEAIDGNYKAAITIADSVLSIKPNNNDAKLLLAKTYSWQGDYDTAYTFLEPVYVEEPKNETLYDIWLNTLLWDKKFTGLIKKADVAEANEYQNEYNLALKRLYAYDGLMEYDSAVDLFKPEAQKVLLDSTPLFNVYRDVLIKSKKNTITGYYSVDLFDNNNPKAQHLAFIDYGLKIKKHTLIFRLNYANRFDTDGLQLEADYYHVLKKGKYFYFNYGISLLNDVFPKHRAGVEYYFPLKKKFEASFGARYMYFTDKHVPILTGHLGKYINKYWFAIRPFYTFDENGNSLSLVANVRRFGDISFNYWGVELGYGNSPDERYLINPTGDYFNLNSYRIKLEKSLMVTTTNDLKISIGFAYEETQKSIFRNRYTIEIIYKHRL